MACDPFCSAFSFDVKVFIVGVLTWLGVEWRNRGLLDDLCKAGPARDLPLP